MCKSFVLGRHLDQPSCVLEAMIRTICSYSPIWEHAAGKGKSQGKGRQVKESADRLTCERSMSTRTVLLEVRNHTFYLDSEFRVLVLLIEIVSKVQFVWTGPVVVVSTEPVAPTAGELHVDCKALTR